MSAPASGTARCLLDLVRLRARRLALWIEYLWQSGHTSPDQGPAIGPGEVARLLAAEEAAQAEAAFLATGPAAALTESVEAAGAALGDDAGWQAILTAFALSEPEADLLTLLLAVELDPGLGRVVAYLHDDGRLTQPSAWLAARLFGRPPAPLDAAALLRWRLAAPLDGADASRLVTAWQADPAVALYVASGAWRDRALIRITPEAVALLPMLHRAVLDRLGGLADLREAELVGPPGIGRQTVAAQAAAATGRSLLVADLPALVASGVTPAQVVTRVLREAVITGAVGYFRDADDMPPAEWAQARGVGVPFLRGLRHPSGTAQPLTLAPLPIADRLAAWRHATAASPPAGFLAQRLTPAEIVAAAASPDSMPRRHGRRPDNALLATLPCPYQWDDLVMPAEVLTQLRAFEAQVRLRWTVYEEWGFARLTHLGQGIAALFGGPSGTGKTMAAQVLARSLELDLLRVDLAGVVNKYVGETEKKLREVFDACEDSGALLFFDEADALFGTRTQVKDAHDRFANIEIDYLLQRIERFDGIAILATNRRQDLDSGFVRRLRFVIEFAAPRPEERLALWRRALLPAAPNGETILDALDWAYLAERLHMTGAEIKGTALAAAFMARDEGCRIGMRHVLAAAQREMAKQGQKLRVPLKEALG